MALHLERLVKYYTDGTLPLWGLILLAGLLFFFGFMVIHFRDQLIDSAIYKIRNRKKREDVIIKNTAIQNPQQLTNIDVANPSEIEGMQYCIYCGAKIPEGSQYCMKCGKQLPKK